MTRLLNRQIKSHLGTKVWIMYQGENFNKGDKLIKPANESFIWCPTENLTSFELSKGDRILFVKTKGISTQILQKEYLNNGTISNEWRLNEIWIGEVVSKITSRFEYCLENEINYFNSKLWRNDPIRQNKWRWSRVFSFKYIKCINVDISMSQLHKIKQTQGFVEAVYQAYCYNKSREITLEEYRDLLESII